ncbi:MAG TPA: hypothetical protein EYM68_04910, partial [Gammaproteobacteria bacterium]|nr:hypothetical protein [Gammaproteobacteria bacterium]
MLAENQPRRRQSAFTAYMLNNKIRWSSRRSALVRARQQLHSVNPATKPMTQELRVPVLPESVAEATVLDWRVDIDQPIHRDDIIVELETDKVVLEVPAPADGKLIEIRCPTGAVVTSEDILGLFEAGQIAVESTAPEPGAKTTPRQT